MCHPKLLCFLSSVDDTEVWCSARLPVAVMLFEVFCSVLGHCHNGGSPSFLSIALRQRIKSLNPTFKIFFYLCLISLLSVLV